MAAEAERTSQILLDIGAVTLNLENPYTYVSAIRSPVYTDCRLLMGYPQERRTIAHLLAEKIAQTGNFDVIAGTATAGIPHAAWVSERLGKPMVYVRSEAKGHGKQNQIEGPTISDGQKVAVVEDLISTGSSSIATVEALREAGATVDFIFAIMTYGMAKADENFAKTRVRPIVLATFEDLVTKAAAIGQINDSQREVILDWTKDTAGWWNRVQGQTT